MDNFLDSLKIWISVWLNKIRETSGAKPQRGIRMVWVIKTLLISSNCKQIWVTTKIYRIENLFFDDSKV